MRKPINTKNTSIPHRSNKPSLPQNRGDDDAIVFGRKPVLEILKHQKHRIKKLLVRQGAKLEKELNTALEAIGQVPQITLVEELDSLTGFARHQGMVLVLKRKEEYSLEKLIEQSLKRNKLIVVLDEVTDPHNLGAVMRAAETSGADGIIVTTDRSVKLTSAAVRASAGACEFIPMVSVGNLQRALKELKKSGYWVVGLDGGPGTQDLYQTKIPSPLVVVLGSEGKGIRVLTAKECDLLVAIPMEGFIESLNVSQAASVFLYEIMRRRRG